MLVKKKLLVKKINSRRQDEEVVGKRSHQASIIFPGKMVGRKLENKENKGKLETEGKNKSHERSEGDWKKRRK